jgi:hypothetical protein
MRIAAFFLVLTASALSTANAEPQSVAVKDWTVKLFDDGSSGAQTSNDSGSSFGVYCTDEKNCVAFLLASTDCDDSSKYPVLLNSTSGAMALATTCANISTPGSKQRFALVFDDFSTVLNIALKDRMVGFSIPMANGAFKVTRFSLDGSNEAVTAMNKAIQGKTKPVRLKDQVL